MKRFIPHAAAASLLLCTLGSPVSTQESEAPYEARRDRLMAEVGGAPVILPGEREIEPIMER